MSTAATKRRILLVDDDEDILDLLTYNLSREGYAVKTLADSTQVLPEARAFHPDLVILDLMMTPFNGIEACRMIRGEQTFQDIYIFFLTAKSDGYYQHAAFNVGGDEFVEKIIGLKPLMSKVRSVLKENYVIRKRLNKVRAGAIELVRGTNTAIVNGHKIALPRNEFDILFFLVQNEGKTIPLRQIISSLWGSTTFMDEKAALNYIDNVRRKIGKEFIEEKRLNLFRARLNQSSKDDLF